MITIDSFPKNKEKFTRLTSFCDEILEICKSININPVLSGSLAVFAYTRNPKMNVNDIDLACSEAEFPRIARVLGKKGIQYKLKEWHVLQVLRGDLKVDFDSIEYWMKGIPENYDRLLIDGCEVKIVRLDGLIELYRRGMEDTRDSDDENNRAKHEAIKAKYEELLGCGRS